jgi:hypothetical protein
MKKLLTLLALLALTGCTTAPVDPTSSQQLAAGAVEDVITLALTPVLAKNPDYLPGIQAVANSLATFSGATLSPADTNGMLLLAAKSSPILTPDLQKQIAAEINAAWGIYAKKYQVIANGSIRPDVKLFVAAVANGINAAIAAQPKA